MRTATAKNSAPYNIVQISYQVYRGTTATAANAIFSTPYLAEVIPGASILLPIKLHFALSKRNVAICINLFYTIIKHFIKRKSFDENVKLSGLSSI